MGHMCGGGGGETNLLCCGGSSQQTGVRAMVWPCVHVHAGWAEAALSLRGPCTLQAARPCT